MAVDIIKTAVRFYFSSNLYSAEGIGLLLSYPSILIIVVSACKYVM